MDHDIDYLYGLLMESHMDLMYLPSGAVAWLHDRPEAQVQTAARIGGMTRQINPVVNAALLRSDQNILVLHLKDGRKFQVYPDGGIGHEGRPVGMEEFSQMMGVMDGPGCAEVGEGLGNDLHGEIAPVGSELSDTDTLGLDGREGPPPETANDIRGMDPSQQPRDKIGVEGSSSYTLGDLIRASETSD